MMGERPVGEPAEVIIWSTTALLGVLLGIGLAFTVWSQLHTRGESLMLGAAVVAVGAGIGLVSASIKDATARLFLLSLSAALILGFFAGGPVFAQLAG